MSTPVAIVTGSAQGIGAAICTELLKNGYRVCIADIQELKAEEFSRELQKSFGEEKVFTIRCDVTKESDVLNVFEQTLKYFKRVDLLVNNAGIIEEYDPRKCLEINALGTIFGCQAALKYMGKSKGGNGGMVINMASIGGLLPAYFIPVYALTKHGIVGLTRSYGHPFHYNKDEIIFSALCPNFVDTNLTKEIKTLDPDIDISIYGSLFSPEFVAKGVLKILADKINGSTLLVIPNEYRYVELDEKLNGLLP